MRPAIGATTGGLEAASDRLASRSPAAVAGAEPKFADRARDARRLLWIEFGGLGDHLHSLPALWLLRQNCPLARISVLSGRVGAELFRGLAPWIDEVHPYLRAGLRADLGCVRQLRASRFDAALQLMQSSRGTAFVALSGARWTLVRRNDEFKSWWWQSWATSQVVEQPYHRFPMYLQRWRALNAAGLSGEEPASLAAGAHAVIDTHLRRALGITPADDKTYLHFSASATDDLRDLPPQQVVELCRTLHAVIPQLRIVISSNQSERGRAKLGALLTALPFAPWKVFAGALSIPAFASVVQGAALHVGPDSGGLHVARVAGTPSVSWFRPNAHICNWLPIEPGHQAFVAPESRPEGLHGLDTAALVASAVSLLPGTHCTVPATVGDRHA